MSRKPWPFPAASAAEDEADRMADLRAESRVVSRMCLECGCLGYHADGCPGAEDEEGEE